jgi:diguanylate cyclase (GGDEF)-like protein
MPKLRQLRPDSAAARRTASQAPNRWLQRAANWLKESSGALSQAIADEPPMTDSFAEFAAKAREPEEVRVELVRLASVLTGAARVELFDDRHDQSTRRIASWPPAFPNEMTIEPRSKPRGPIGGTVARSIQEKLGHFVLQIPLKAGDTSYGTLRLTAANRRHWSSKVVRRLGTLCAIASAAERGLGRPHREGTPSTSDHPQGPHEASILAAFLTFAQAQARRRHEPLSLMEVAVDRLDSIRELLGDELAEAAIERVIRAIKSTIRASDVVARLEDGRIAVLLPNANVDNALKVAETIRTAIARAGAASTTMPTLSASIGLATYPDHAHDVATLRAAASTTLTRAREQGNHQLATAPDIPAIALPTLNHRVG